MEINRNPIKSIGIRWESNGIAWKSLGIQGKSRDSNKSLHPGQLGLSKICKICEILAGRAQNLRNLEKSSNLSDPGAREIGSRGQKTRENHVWWFGCIRSPWFCIFLNFAPFSIYLLRMHVLSAPVPALAAGCVIVQLTWNNTDSQ